MPESKMHSYWMREALKLARKAWGRTSPNPMVGAVLVKNGKLVGKGFHHRAGEPHAEINAIADAGSCSAGCDIYVTLEPCSTTGRTGPCTQAIIDAGISRVFIGALDPNPSHAGAAIPILQAAGTEVASGIEETKCAELNQAFNKWIVTGMPYVLLKLAMTLDGKIATVDGKSRWITGPVARRRVQKIRQWCDAIMVGGETARKDHPSLNVREPANWPNQPERIIVSRSMSNEQAAGMLPEGNPPEVIAPDSPGSWRTELKKLGKKQVTALLIEGGGELAAAVLQAKIVDKVELHYAPKILGGRNSRSGVGGIDPGSLDFSVQLKNMSIKKLGDDFSVIGYPYYK